MAHQQADKTYQEIADELNMPRDEVRDIARKAMAKLQRALKREGITRQNWRRECHVAAGSEEKMLAIALDYYALRKRAVLPVKRLEE